MNKNPQVFLKHILESIGWIENNVKGVSKEEFLTNVPVQDAVIRRMEIIGEAIKNLSDDFKDKYPNVSWQDISDMRNKLIHGYFGVDINLVWNVIQKDIPTLKNQVREILSKQVGSKTEG